MCRHLRGNSKSLSERLLVEEFHEGKFFHKLGTFMDCPTPFRTPGFVLLPIEVVEKVFLLPLLFLTQAKNQQFRGLLNKPQSASAEFFNISNDVGRVKCS